MSLTALIFTFLFCLSTHAAEKTHTLVLGLDGISYQTMLSMHEGGYFREFKSPIPMVATFPSISDPNWAHLLNAPVEKGFTKAGFEFSKNKDGSIGKEYGTLIDHLTSPPAYEKKFNFRAEGVFQHLMTMTWSETSALFWIESIERFLLEPKNLGDRKITTAFIMNTDIISHVGGEKKIKEYLKNLSKQLNEMKDHFKSKYKKNLEIVIVSDHGNHFAKPEAIDYKSALENKGFNQKSTLRNKTDYAFIAPEIISVGAFYTLPGEEKTFAKNFSDIKGVHVAIVNSGKNKISIYSKEGETLLTVNPKTKTLSYKVISGKDPFDQISLFKNGPLHFNDYFYKTLKTDYPNALIRAWEAFYKNSEIKPSVIVSAELGYVFTNLTLEILTAVSGVKSTHGSFHREESLGAIMTTLPLSEEALTPFQLNDWLKKFTL